MDFSFPSMVNMVIKEEWEQFQQTDNEGGRAQCQGNWPMFNIMRGSQFLVWTEELLESYYDDLISAKKIGRNLITEKYARMMETTAPALYRQTIAPYIEKLNEDRISFQESIIRTQVAWAQEFCAQYPHLGQSMRTITTDQDSENATSLETYLRGELSTYSPRTLDLYARFILDIKQKEKNLTRMIVEKTVLLSGYSSLENAEKEQKSSVENGSQPQETYKAQEN